MLPKNVKELMNGVVDILLTSLNEVLRVEINAAAAWAVQAGVQGSQFAAFKLAKVHYDVIERLSNQIWTDMKRVLEEIQIPPYQELGQDLKGYFKEKMNAPYSVCRAGVYARLQGVAAQPSFENHYENLQRKIFAEVDLFSAKLEAQESEKKANRMSANFTSIVCGDNSRVLVNSQDNSINVANSKLLFAKILNAVDSQIDDKKLKQDLLEKIAEMEAHVGKGSFIKSYSDFVALAANHMTIIVPFLPELTQLLQAGGIS
jgi:hypothetical protein